MFHSATECRFSWYFLYIVDLAASQNLWISGLSSLTRATDLKAVFSKHGKVSSCTHVCIFGVTCCVEQRFIVD